MKSGFRLAIHYFIASGFKIIVMHSLESELMIQDFFPQIFLLWQTLAMKFLMLVFVSAT